MTRASLFTKTLVLIVVLFGIIATATSILSGLNLYGSLPQEYQSKGVAIAKSIADSSVEMLLNADVSTIQSVVDQFTEIEGVSYVIVFDGQGEAISHTLFPPFRGMCWSYRGKPELRPLTAERLRTTCALKEWEISWTSPFRYWRASRDTYMWEWTEV